MHAYVPASCYLYESGNVPTYDQLDYEYTGSGTFNKNTIIRKSVSPAKHLTGAAPKAPNKHHCEEPVCP